MSEIADELDRLADEFDKSRQDQQDRCAKAMEAGAAHAEVSARARGAALEEAVNRLRERATELRAQRSGPTYKPQPKPAEVRLDQRWLWAHHQGALTVVYAYNRWVRLVPIDQIESFAPERFMADERDMLSSPDWTYLGDGPEPAR